MGSMVAIGSILSGVSSLVAYQLGKGSPRVTAKARLAGAAVLDPQASTSRRETCEAARPPQLFHRVDEAALGVRRKINETGDGMFDSQQRFSVAVIGGGAAGLTAALWAAKAGASTILLEGSKQCGLKILVSGGGRCNVMPSEYDLTDFHTSGSKNVLKRIFKTWSRDSVQSFFERDLGVELDREPGTGKLFPAEQKSRVVRDALTRACAQAGVQTRLSWRVRTMDRLPVVESEAGDTQSNPGFRIASNDGEVIHADRVILATGGLSLPRTGSDGVGYRFARSEGHSLVPTYPALVPLTTPEPRWTELSGITLPVTWSATRDGKVFESRTRELLLTHRGFSGPAVLDASHWYTRDGARLEVSWGAAEEASVQAALARGGRTDSLSLLTQWVPRRLAKWLLDREGIPESKALAQLTRAQRQGLVRQLVHCPLDVHGSVGYRVAEVTGGGVPLSEINPSTLESRCGPNLYLCGEILDVVGRIGGYNFLWAWVTGRLAGESAARAGG